MVPVPKDCQWKRPREQSQTRRTDLLKVTLQWQSLEFLPPHPTSECSKLFPEAQIYCQFILRRKYCFSKIFQNRSLSIWRQWFVLGYIIYALFLHLCWSFLACRNNIISTSMALAYITLEERNISSICFFCLTDCIQFHFTLCCFCFYFLWNTPYQEGQIGTRFWIWFILPVTSKHFPSSPVITHAWTKPSTCIWKKTSSFLLQKKKENWQLQINCYVSDML